ncbi:O-antigen/teichoic acid export membrane protein [Sphingobium wenxiniae]|uniref:O-antigen/teichoic acid export membrane protein n=1 Tax=Sphingobium wenxiniae (strain DSM 21828 / CGMCC 1.7748 / JZ-1) TaxID=595605 RepID=A0A562K517_SPHWJ|nr:lipopolysaccharide biosynthesis protein [Sphingobium wenxiniae]MBB6192836.1 O-antigen/teichoic acid export membrane protein [Sphingobium wenxiniae]TWH90528.1 O-antigen/teichoic acid export membrane protein [Sphingobium wenxiniae]
MNRSRRLVSGIIGGALGRSVSLIAPFLVMPIMLRYLGDTHFGIWMTAVSITSMAQFSDLGIGNGLLTRLSAAFGRDDIVSARADISSAYAMLTCVALILSVISGGLLLASNLRPFGISTQPASLAIVASVLVAFFAGIPASIIQRVMYARQQVMLSNLWQIAGASVAVIACWAAVTLKLPPWAAVLAYGLPAALALAGAGLWYFVRNPELRPRLSDVRKDSSRQLLTLGIRFLALGILTSVALNVDNVIIAANAGAHAVTQYSVPAKIGSLLGLVITTIFLPLWAANGEALARGDFDWVRNNSRRMVWIGGGGVAVAAMILTLAGDRIIYLWMGRNFSDQQMILGLLGGLSVVMAIASPANMVLNAIGQIRIQIIAWAIFALITIALKLAFVTEGHLWLVPAISLIMYAIIITPAMWKTAGNALRH